MSTSRPVFHPPAAPMPGTAGVAEWIRGERVTSVTMLVDTAVVDQPITTRLRAQVERAGLVPTVRRTGGNGDLEAIDALARTLPPGAVVIGVGGGSTLDLAKLAALAAERPETLRWLASPQRSGMIMLPPRLNSPVRMLAVPTTLGTGSELGTVACYSHGAGKRLVTGACLRPVAAIHDAAATATLPIELVADGALEALFRTVSPYTGDPVEQPAADAMVEQIAGRLLGAGYEVARHRRAELTVPAGLRLRIAALSGESQVGHTNLGRSVYAVKAWPIANELSTTLGLPKMRTVAAVWPVLWRRAVAGDARVGDRNRIRRLWRVLHDRAPWLDSDPARGLVQLMRDWQITHDVHADDDELDTAVVRTMRAWGAGLPMLGGLTAPELRAVLAEATTPRAVPAHRGSGFPQTSAA